MLFCTLLRFMGMICEEYLEKSALICAAWVWIDCLYEILVSFLMDSLLEQFSLWSLPVFTISDFICNDDECFYIFWKVLVRKLWRQKSACQKVIKTEQTRLLAGCVRWVHSACWVCTKMHLWFMVPGSRTPLLYNWSKETCNRTKYRQANAQTQHLLLIERAWQKVLLFSLRSEEIADMVSSLITQNLHVDSLYVYWKNFAILNTRLFFIMGVSLRRFQQNQIVGSAAIWIISRSLTCFTYPVTFREIHWGGTLSSSKWFHGFNIQLTKLMMIGQDWKLHQWKMKKKYCTLKKSIKNKN